MLTGSDSRRLASSLFREAGRTDVGHPNLDRPQPLLSQADAVATNLVSGWSNGNHDNPFEESYM
jgi:hypothetical protein